MSDYLIVPFKVIPNKRLNRIVDKTNEGIYRIELKAKPIEGQANLELLRFLGKLLNLRQDQITILTGLHSKNKIVKINSVDKERIQEKINSHIQPP
jgi:uncharacterized protein YggU (UPF0235/DUF167 family)